MQLCHRCCANELPRLNVAVPVNVADVSAPSVIHSPLEDLILLVGGNLTEDQSPGPAHRGVTGWVGAVGSQSILIIRGADRLPLAHERPCSLVVVLGFVRRQSRIGE